MSEKRLFIKKISHMLCVCLLLSFCAMLCACSDDDALNDATRASILVTHNIEARTVSGEIKKVTYYCYNKQGYRTFGPANLVKAPQILLQAVPVESVSISMAYYNGDNKIVGFYSQPVKLEIGEVYEISDPNWEDIDSVSNLKRLRVLQNDYRIHTDDSISMAVMADFEDTALGTGITYRQYFSDYCEWFSSDRAVIDNLDEDNDGEDVSTLGKKEFKGKTPGNGIVVAKFNNAEDSADVEVTEAMITGVAFDETELVLPLALEYCIDHVTATWSDGKTSCVDLNSAWTSGDGEVVGGYYGYIVPKKLSAGENEDEEVAEITSVPITASVICGGDTFSDTCRVIVVAGAMKGITLEADSDGCAVGEEVAYRVMATYARSGYSSADYELDGFSYTLTNSDPSVVSADDGLITGLTAGSTVLKATSNENSDFSDSLTFTVTEAEE